MPGLRHRPQNDLHPSPISNPKSSLSLFLSLSHSILRSISLLLFSPLGFSQTHRVSFVYFVTSFIENLRRPLLPLVIVSFFFTAVASRRFVFVVNFFFLFSLFLCFFFFSFELLVPILFLLSVSDFVRTVVARYERHRERRG